MTIEDIKIETEQETDGRWIAEATNLPGVMVYGASQEEAISNCLDLVARVLRDKAEDEGEKPKLIEVWETGSKIFLVCSYREISNISKSENINRVIKLFAKEYYKNIDVSTNELRELNVTVRYDEDPIKLFSVKPFFDFEIE